jgi:trimeric autotransporter adhesin
MVTMSTGIITTVAGTGKSGPSGYSGDGGLATSARFNFPSSIAIASSGNIFIADAQNHRIRMVMKSTGIISTVTGNGRLGYSRDGGPATSAVFYYPHGVAVDASRNIFIGDTGNDRIRVVTTSTGIITTVAGTGAEGYSGDGGLATSAKLFRPSSIAIDASGNIFIAEYFNYRIRMVTKSTGIITTVAGNGRLGYSGDGGQAHHLHCLSLIVSMSMHQGISSFLILTTTVFVW